MILKMKREHITIFLPSIHHELSQEKNYLYKDYKFVENFDEIEIWTK